MRSFAHFLAPSHLADLSHGLRFYVYACVRACVRVRVNEREIIIIINDLYNRGSTGRQTTMSNAGGHFQEEDVRKFFIKKSY